MKTRLKKSASQVPVPQSRADMENLLAQIAGLKFADAEMKLDYDKRVAEIKKEFDELFAAIGDELKPLLDAAETWATNNPAEFGKNKSIKMLHGTVGFRTGNNRLALLNRAWTWERVLETIKKFSAWKNCVRIKEEVNKEQILSDISRNYERDQEIIAKTLSDVGLKVVQGESFFVETNLTPVQKRETITA